MFGSIFQGASQRLESFGCQGRLHGDGEPRSPGLALNRAGRIHSAVDERRQGRYPRSMKAPSLDILYLDSWMVAVNKPAGLMVHRSRLDPRLPYYALQLIRDRLGRKVYPVHRLDRPTSGILLFALHPTAAHRLAQSFARKTVEKIYLAVVRGYLPSEGQIDAPLKPDPLRHPADPRRKEALTRYRLRATVELPYAVGRYQTCRYSLAEVRPVTGRMHQIRRHFRHISHPLLGDKKYGDNKHNRFLRATLGCRRMLLAAVELTLPHPATDATVTLHARLDETFGGFLEQMDWSRAVPRHWLPGAAGLLRAI